MKIVYFIFCMMLSPTCFGLPATGNAIVNFTEVEATVKIEGPAAQKLFESLEVFPRIDGRTVRKETSEVACFQFYKKTSPNYSCAIFVFVSKDFISTKSRYSKQVDSVSKKSNL